MVVFVCLGCLLRKAAVADDAFCFFFSRKTEQQEALDRACEDARAHGSYYKRNATSSLLRHRRSLRPTNSRLDVSKAFEGGWEASRDVSPGGDEEEERERGRETAMDEDEEEAEERTTRNE